MFANPFEQQIPFNPYQAQFGGSPFQQGGFGGSPFQQAGLGGSPFQQAGLGWNPMQAGAGLGGQVGFGASPFGQQQAGGVSPFGAQPSPFVNPSIIAQLAALNPQLIPYIAQQLTQLQRPEASAMGAPWAGMPGGGTPFASAQGYPGQVSDPLTSMLLAQSMAQQGPIRPLTGPSPFELQRTGVGGGISPMMGQTVDPYTLLLRAQALSQLANPFEQANRGYPGISGVGGYGSPFGAGRPVPFG
jgi:hypothetical protein